MKAKKIAMQKKLLEQNTVRVGLRDQPDSIRKLPRQRMNQRNIDLMFKVETDHLVDEYGGVVWPKDWAAECMPPPALYFIMERKVVEIAPDPREQPEYTGGTIVCAMNVPEEVQGAHLKAWIVAGLDDEDHAGQVSDESLRKAETTLEALHRVIEELPALHVDESVEAAEGSVLHEKRLRAKRMMEERDKLEIKVGLSSLECSFGCLFGSGSKAPA